MDCPKSPDKDIECETNSKIYSALGLWEYAARQINRYRQSRQGVTPACAETIREILLFIEANINLYPIPLFALLIIPVQIRYLGNSNVLVLWEPLHDWSFGIYVDADGLGYLEVCKAGENDTPAGSVKPHILFAADVCEELILFLKLLPLIKLKNYGGTKISQ